MRYRELLSDEEYDGVNNNKDARSREDRPKGLLRKVWWTSDQLNETYTVEVVE